MAKILDGKIVRDKIAKELETKIKALPAGGPPSRRPKLVIIQVGNLPESNAYINQKVKFGERIGSLVDHQKFAENISQDELTSNLQQLNADSSVHGIIVQMPIAKHLDKDTLIDSIDPAKDVDGLSAVNVKHLWENTNKGFIPATTKGILTLLDYYEIPIAGKKATIVGRSYLVGKPTAIAFLNRGATVTVCHSQTKDLKTETRNAEILVVAVGKPNLITKEHVSKGQVVIDVGINVVENRQKTNDKGLLLKPEGEPETRKLVGDVAFDEVSKIVSAITPVPGGIGPMTVASLFENLLEAYKRQTI